MPRSCTICAHPEVESLNKSICNNVSYRNIALQAGTTATTVMRHIEGCLKLEMTALRKENRIEQAFNFEAELHALYQRAGKMVHALEKWLHDPDNPDEFNIDPRDSEMTVVYLDHTDLNKQTGEPKQKKGNLRQLLKKIDAESDNEPIGVISAAVDNRKLYLDAFKTLNDRIEQIAKFYGHWTKDKENPADLKSVARTVAEFRQRIATDAEIYAATNGKYGHPMPDESFVEAEIGKLLKTHKVLPEQLATEMGKIG